MALNPKNVEFLFKQLTKAEINNYTSIATQLFNYLDIEIKDNPIYDKYENSFQTSQDWIKNAEHGEWTLPNNLEESKLLTYSIYRTLSRNGKDWFINFITDLFYEQKLADSIYRFNDNFLGYYGKALEDIINANPEFEEQPATKTRNDTVFIIHGHDNELKLDIQLLLNRAGVNNIVLHEQPDKGRTIIDKLLDETSKAGYAIALLTPDDVLENNLKRARQNVVLEIGYFIGLLGKERLRLIVKGDVEVPSDLQGILYEKYDSSGSWKIKLLKEMQAVGIYTDMQAVINKF